MISLTKEDLTFDKSKRCKYDVRFIKPRGFILQSSKSKKDSIDFKQKEEELALAHQVHS